MNPVKNYRKKNGLTQAQMAKFLGTQQSFVARIEIGDIKVPAERAILWAQQVPEWSLFDLRPDLNHGDYL